MEAVHPELVRIALDRSEGHEFERFANQFYPTLVGARFVPLGGVKDGGADAFEGDPVHEEDGDPEVFYQASVQEDFRAKIRRTVDRLREFGRSPYSLVYVTSRTIRLIDSEERSLSRELSVNVRIRDASYIVSHVNDSVSTRSAYNSNLAYLTEFLKNVGSSRIITSSPNIKSPAVYVFLEQQLARRRGDTSLVDAVTDSLALWALEGTDPEGGLFRTREDVLERICTEIPAARNVVAKRVGRRLEYLSKKEYPGGRRVRWHKKDNNFCLPYDTRLLLEEENREDESLRLDVLTSISGRIASAPQGHLTESETRRATELALRAIQMSFEKEGVEFASFLENGTGGLVFLSDSLREVMSAARVEVARRHDLMDAALIAIRGVLYSSTERERAYLEKLSRTYTLLFTLNTEPRLIEYFQDVAGKLYLYVGSDLLVRALSERFLPSADRHTVNTLLATANLGADLVLTEPVLEEVVGNLRAADAEFRNWFAALESHIDDNMARHAPKILNRAYFYSRLNTELGDTSPKSWIAYVGTFLPHADLFRPQAFDHLRVYLMTNFQMSFEENDELLRYVPVNALEELTDSLAEKKSRRELARNDAMLALAVFGRRKKKHERSRVSEFGYETWWLTGEMQILRHTRTLVRDNQGARYMMRPDFLLNFVTLAPSVEDARTSLARVFPSVLGIKLSRRMDEDAYKKIIGSVKEIEEQDEGRRTAAIASLADKLKADFQKRYDESIS